MRVLENLLNLTGDMAPNYRSNNNTALPIETKVVGNEQWIRAIPPSKTLSTYMVNQVPEPLPERITHSVEVNPEVDCSISDFRHVPKANLCTAGVWTRLSITVNEGDSDARRGYSIICNNPEIVGKWIRIRKPISVAGDHEPDIWTPPHTALTPEQIALMKYGEFEEAKQI